MLKISREQMAAFMPHLRQGFERRLANRVEALHPEHAELIGESGVRELVRRGIAKSSGYGIDTERTVADFVDMMIEFGADFDMQDDKPWVREILRDPEMSAQTKLNLLHLRLTGRLREG